MINKAGTYNMINILCISATAFLLLLCSAGFASAHKVNIYAYAENGKVFVEGYYVDGTEVKNSPVEVFDAVTGELLLNIKTNINGKASFNIPKIVSLRLVLSAGMGHKNDYMLGVEEIEIAMGRQPQDELVDAVRASNQMKKPAVQETGLSDDHHDIEAVVEKIVEKKTEPLKQMILQMQKSSSKPGLTEIIGGIGYIMGIMGIIMYFKSRKG